MHTYQKKCPPVHRMHLCKNEDYHLWWENSRGHRVPVENKIIFHKDTKFTLGEKEYENLADLADVDFSDELFANEITLKDKYNRYIILYTERLYTIPVHTFMEAPKYVMYIAFVEDGKLYFVKKDSNSDLFTVTEDAEVIPHSLYRRIASKKCAKHIFSEEYEVVRDTILF